MEKIKRRVDGQVIEIFQVDSKVKIQVLKEESNKSNERTRLLEEEIRNFG